MNEQFLGALQKLETLEPENVVKQILELFSSISVMSKAEAIAAYQTARFFLLRVIPRDDKKRSAQIAEITDALVGRLLDLVAEAPAAQRVAMAAHLEQVITPVGYTDKFHKLVEVIRYREQTLSRY